MGKITKMTKSIFDYDNNPSISVFDDILTNYSHFKLNKWLGIDNIRRMFEYFIQNGMQKFIQSLPEESQDSYKIALQNFINKLYLH